MILDDRVLDLSEYQSDIDFARLREVGIRRTWIGSNTAAISAGMCSRAAAQGLLWGTYAFLYFGNRTDTWRTAISNALDYGAPRIILDVEAVNEPGQRPQERAGITPNERIAILRQAVAEVRAAGLRPWIYSAYWYWTDQMANTQEFAGLPLVIAAYGPGSAPREPITVVNWGGWRDVWMHQYTSIVAPYPGYRGVDHNYLLKDDEEGLMMGQYEDLDTRLAEVERRTGGNDERARNADLLKYCDGLNTAIHKLIVAGQGTQDDDRTAVADALELAANELRGIAAHVDAPANGGE